MKDKKQRARDFRIKPAFYRALRECAAPMFVVGLFLCAMAAGILLSVAEVIPLASMLTLSFLVITTNLSVSVCLVTVGSLTLLALTLSGLEWWRISVLFLTFMLPSLVLFFFRGYPARVANMLKSFCEESEKLETKQEICALAVRLLRGSRFFRNIALLLWDKRLDNFQIVAATSAYEIGSRVAGAATYYVKCHDTLKVASFIDPESSIYFLPSSIQARSAICAPVHLGGKRFGVLVAESSRARPWSRASRQVLHFFSTVLSYSLAELEKREKARAVQKAGVMNIADRRFSERSAGKN